MSICVSMDSINHDKFRFKEVYFKEKIYVTFKNWYFYFIVLNFNNSKKENKYSFLIRYLEGFKLDYFLI